MALPRDGGAQGATAERWAWPALAAIVALAPALFWQGGVVEEEAIGFLRNFWGSRPVLARIFDPRGFDFYQARELSYALDFLDAQWMRLLFSCRVFVFVPPSAVAAALGVVAIGFWLAPRALPGLSHAARWLTLLVFLSNFALASTTGLLYRATKPLVAAILLGLLLFTLAEQRRPRLGPRAAFGATFAAALATSLLDRQGLFYVLLLTAALATAWLCSRRGLPLALGAAVAILAWVAYERALGPFLIHLLNGYWPETRFERLRPRWLLDPSLWFAGGRLLGDWTRVLLGGLPPAIAALAAAAGGTAWAWSERRRPRLVALGASFAVLFVVAQLMMVAIMVKRHQPVTWIDHRFWYYPLPFQALLVFAVLWGLERVALARGSLPRGLLLALAGLVVLNLAQWPERRLIMESGPWFSDVARRSALLERSLRQGHAEPLLDGDYRRFYFECLDRFPRLRTRATPQVQEGAGFALSGLRGGRVVAEVAGDAHLVATTREAGPHWIAGAARLGGTEGFSVLLGSQPARLLGSVRRDARGDGPVFFRFAAELPAGPSDILLLPSGPIELLLPVAIWSETTSTSRGSVAVPIDSSGGSR